MPKPDQKNVTVRLPIELWKRLKLAQIEGQIASINQAALEGVQLVLDSLEDERLINRG